MTAVEPLGAETLLVLALRGNDEECVARVGRDSTAKLNDTVMLYFDTASIHIFDRQTTKALHRTVTAGG